MDFVERELESNRAKRILDIGCGTGRHAIELAKRCEQIELTGLLNGPNDTKNCFFSIHAGAGGTETGGQQAQKNVHGEGNYAAARQYNEGLKKHVQEHDIERAPGPPAARTCWCRGNHV